jgi:uncharacterized protein DUF4139
MLSRHHAPLLALLAAPLLGGCSSGTTYVRSPDAALGRVVIYRNGIAYFERRAHVANDTLTLQVPADKVDDFLKSLVVTDAKTGDPAPVSYPSVDTLQRSPDGLIAMNIKLAGGAPHDLRLTYVTEAPSWKPSYRVTLGKGGHVTMQAWAIVDNTSGEDWQNVRLGVGSSSALSFRFDLRSIRTVQRETLQSGDLLAIAPPTGGAAYGQQQAPQRVVVDLDDRALAAKDEEERTVARADVLRAEPFGRRQSTSPPPPPPAPKAAAMKKPATEGVGRGAAAPAGVPGSVVGGVAGPGQNGYPTTPAQQGEFQNALRNLRTTQNQIVIEGYADANDADKNAAALSRANRAREKLIRDGVPAERVVAVAGNEQNNRAGGVRIVEVPPGADRPKGGEAQPPAGPGEPIGTSHFETKTAMNVPRGSSAMVSVVNAETDGEVVYFYDPESARGNASYAFRSLRLKNPSDSTLESGPVTVFGEGRFVGEGLSEPIPAHATAFVPFALDRQIFVETKEAERDHVSRVLSVQRGVCSTEVKHTRRKSFVLHNRTAEKATVYVRHNVRQGYALGKGPSKPERLGASHVFKVEVAPGGRAEVEIEESTPVYKTVDLRSPGDFSLVLAHVAEPEADPKLKRSLGELSRLRSEMTTLEEQQSTMREQMEEYRARMNELHGQLVTLKAVKTAGPLMQNLERKMAEVSDKLAKGTTALVGLQEKHMLAKIRFQNELAELSLGGAPAGGAAEKL